MTTTIMKLSTKTNCTVAGPWFQNDKGNVTVVYDFEHDDGSIEKAQVVFEEVLAFEYRQGPCCRADDILAPDEIQCLTESDYLGAVVELWQESVGWQDFHQRKGGAARFKHYTMFFDDSGCVNVVASGCRVT